MALRSSGRNETRNSEFSQQTTTAWQVSIQIRNVDRFRLVQFNISIFSTDLLETAANVTTVAVHEIVKRASGTQIVVECRRTNIMGSLVQNASPFLFPCTIEYSLICAVILYEMWKQTIGIDQPNEKRDRKISSTERNAHHFSVDCSRAHHGMFAGILVIVLTIISLIMFYVLSKVAQYRTLATLQITCCEIVLYVVAAVASFAAFIKMRYLKFSQSFGEMPLDCMLLIVAQSGVYLYCMFSIIGCYFSMMHEQGNGGVHGLIAETLSIVQTSMQTLFILNAWWRRCRSELENRQKPARELITFLIVANMGMWFINALVRFYSLLPVSFKMTKNDHSQVKFKAVFRETHLQFFGMWHSFHMMR